MSNKLAILFNYAGEDVDIILNFKKINQFSGTLEHTFFQLVSASEWAGGCNWSDLGVRIHIKGKSRNDFINMIANGDPGYLHWFCTGNVTL
jgi:hypothetical protein